MRSIKVALATAAVVGATVSGAYAAGVLNKNGHEVDAHAAHGQSVAAAARATHTSEPTEEPTEEPADEPTATESTATDEPTESEPTQTDEPTTAASEDPADDQGENADDQGEEPSAAPTDAGKHLGQIKPHRHYGHAWGKGHGSGRPDHSKPTHRAHPTQPTHPTHPAHPTKG